MAVCRRCGFRTVDETGAHHAPVEHQQARAIRWLNLQARTRYLAKVTGSRDT